MATSATTQSITAGQIGQLCDRLTTKLRDSGLPCEQVQLVLQTPGGTVVDEMLAIFRKHVDAHSNRIVRRVAVNRDRSFQEALDATGRKQYSNADVIKNAPRLGTGNTEDEIVFAMPTTEYLNEDGYMTCQRFDDFMRDIGIEADPQGVCAVLEAEPDFADEHPCSTQWKNAEGNWCGASFLRWRDERKVHVRGAVGGWHVSWWIAGRRKVSA